MTDGKAPILGMANNDSPPWLDPKRDRNESGARKSYHPREGPFRDWHRNTGHARNHEFLSADVDLIEYTYVNRELIPLAVFALVLQDQGKTLWDILEFVLALDATKLQRLVASRLNCPFYLLVYEKPLVYISAFSFQRMEWRLFTKETFGNWLAEMRDRPRLKGSHD